MKMKEVQFYLPIGYQDDNEKFHREGTMRLATALDEIEVHSNDLVMFNKRYRDCLILAQVITRLGDMTEVTSDIIEELYEIDFILLQMLYNKLNTNYEESIITTCPECNNQNAIYLPDLFKELHLYFQQKETEKAEQK